ncbi:MAG: CidA/LrgA family protein [Acinetobacter sp.]
MNTVVPTKPSLFSGAFELIKQLLMLILFWLVGMVLHQKLGVPISAGVSGMLLLLLCLFLKVIKIQQVERGAMVILGELLLFFLPVVVAVVQYKDLFITEGWQIVLSIVIGTMAVMLSTCFTIHFYSKFKSYWQLHKQVHRGH